MLRERWDPAVVSLVCLVFFFVYDRQDDVRRRVPRPILVLDCVFEILVRNQWHRLKIGLPVNQFTGEDYTVYSLDIRYVSIVVVIDNRRPRLDRIESSVMRLGKNNQLSFEFLNGARQHINRDRRGRPASVLHTFDCAHMPCPNLKCFSPSSLSGLSDGTRTHRQAMMK